MSKGYLALIVVLVAAVVGLVFFGFFWDWQLFPEVEPKTEFRDVAELPEGWPHSSCLDGNCPENINEAEPFNGPLYLTIVIHTEEDTQGGTQPKAQIPDYDGDEEVMLHFSMVMREFADMAAEHGAKINFGSDWTFSEGVIAYDPTFYTDLEAMGHEIDAHAHESDILYHEVREKIAEAGGSPTLVASGISEEEIYDKMIYFDKWWPEFQYLWGIAFPGHGAGEDVSGWVWRPSEENWLLHDYAARYIYIGHGEQVNNLDYIQEAVDNRQPNRINTYAIFTNPRDFKAEKGMSGIPDQWTAKPEAPDYWRNRLEWWDDFLTELDALVAGGDLYYASLTTIAETFEDNERWLDFDFTEEDHPRSAQSATERSREAGYYR